MTSPTTAPTRPVAIEDALSLAIAGQLVDSLIARDFGALTDTLTDDVAFRALLPSRVVEVEGPEAVQSLFDMWFGNAEQWEVVEAVVGEVGGRLHLRWRIQCTKPNFGPDALMVEQQLYADAATDGRLRNVALLCTGFRPRPS